LGYATYYYDWDWSGAETEIERAIKLNPGYATARHFYTDYLIGMRRHNEALAEIAKAQQLDPLSLIINAVVAWTLYFARQYDRAIEQCQKTLEMDPNFVVALGWLGQAYLQKEAFQEAITVFQQAIELSDGRPSYLANLGHAYALAGGVSESEELLDRLKAQSAREYVSSYDIAEVYVGLGRKDEAFEWLQKAYEERARALVLLQAEPKLDSLRADPRFHELLRQVGLSH
jgi:tetratricopeptide (TPR) repeat protein